MRTLAGPPAYELSDTERECVELLAKDDDLKWVRRETCLCGSRNSSQILDRDRFGLSFDIRLCEDCGLIYFTETLGEASTGKYYNKYFYPLTYPLATTLLHVYDGHDDRGDFCQYKLVEPHIIAHYSGSELAILDIGAGTGKTLMSFQKNFSRIGIPTNLSAYELNQSWWPEYTEKGIKVIKSLTEEAHDYDLVILSHTLEHLADPIGYLKLLRDLLSPSGIIFVEVPGVFNSHNIEGYVDIQYACPHFHVQLFNAISLTNVAGLAGLEPLEVTEVVRGVFCRGELKMVSPAMLSSNAKRVEAYLKYIKVNEGSLRISNNLGKQEFQFDPFGRGLKQPELPATEIPKLIIRKIDRRLHKYLIIRKIERRLRKYPILQKINRRLRKYLKLL